MSGRLAPFAAALADLDAHSRRRTLRPRAGHDFTSNDYLGLAGSAELAAAVMAALARDVPVGATGSRLLHGNHPEHEALEAEAAVAFGAGRCLFFGSGYAANQALFATLPQRGDLVVYDALSHASTREGVRAGRADAVAARHNDAQHAADLIAAWRRDGGRGTPWVAVESLYSMDGDRAPLADMLALAARYDGFLVVDEAHATGVFGVGGRGLAAELAGHEAVITLHTCGKALGVSGALVAGPPTLIDFLINRARAFIYATAPSPLVAAAVRAALLLCADPARPRALSARVAAAAAMFERLGLAPSGSQIQPAILGADDRALHVAADLRDAGFDCYAIRPPTVPEGTARLRITLTLNVTDDSVAAFGDALDRAMARTA